MQTIKQENIMPKGPWLVGTSKTGVQRKTKIYMQLSMMLCTIPTHKIGPFFVAGPQHRLLISIVFSPCQSYYQKAEDEARDSDGKGSGGPIVEGFRQVVGNHSCSNGQKSIGKCRSGKGLGHPIGG